MDDTGYSVGCCSLAVLVVLVFYLGCLVYHYLCSKAGAVVWWYCRWPSGLTLTASRGSPPGPGRESDVVHRLRLNTMQRPGHTGRKALAKKKLLSLLKTTGPQGAEPAFLLHVPLLRGPE